VVGETTIKADIVRLKSRLAAVRLSFDRRPLSHRVLRLDRARDHLGKHGREQEKVFMAEQCNSDVVTLTKDLVEPSSA
jgi:hypothetical protein